MKYIVMMFLFMPICAMGQYFDIKKGNESYKKGEFDAAKETYEKVIAENPKDDEKKEAIFNNANVSYRKNDYAKAEENYKSLAENTNIPDAYRGDAYYNLGNASFEKYKGTQNPQEKISAIKQSVEYLKQAMQFNANDKDAKQNYEYVKSLLKDLENKQNQNKNNQNKDNKDKKNDKNNKDNKNKDKNKNDKQDKNKQNKDDKNNDKNQDQKNDQQNQDQKQEQAQSPKKYTKDQAARILDAIKQDEKKMLKKYQVKPAKSETLDKDW